MTKRQLWSGTSMRRNRIAGPCSRSNGRRRSSASSASTSSAVAVMCRHGTSTLVGMTCTGRLRSPRRKLARRLGWRANIVAAQWRSRSVSSVAGDIGGHRDHVGVVGPVLAARQLRQREQPLLQRAQRHHVLDGHPRFRRGHGVPSCDAVHSEVTAASSSADNPDALIGSWWVSPSDRALRPRRRQRPRVRGSRDVRTPCAP